MKYCLPLLLSLWICCFHCPAQTATDPPAAFSTAAKNRIASTLASCPDQTEFSIALVQDGNIHHMGLVLDKGQAKPIDNATSLFEIGSITKVFTTHLLMQEANAGKLKLDAPLQSQYKLPIAISEPMTLRQLASHQSGLPSVPANMWKSIFHAKNPYRGYSREKLDQFLAQKAKLKHAPDSAYLYSNLGMAVLTRLLELHSGKSYAQLLEERIFGPLEMEGSVLDRSKGDARLVQGRNGKGKATAHWDLEAFEGAGAILSNVNDLSKYALFWMEALEGELSAMVEENGSVTEQVKVGLGWHMYHPEKGIPFAWHNGGTGGFKSSMGVDAKADCAVVILTNVGRGENRKKVDQLCFSLMQELRNEMEE